MNLRFAVAHSFLLQSAYTRRAAGENVPLFMPENGFIALNIPLTPSRGGSCSTRTMHPYFINKISQVLKDLSIKNEIINPLELKTKGECVSECLNKNLIGSIIEQSVSCSHGTRKQNRFGKRRKRRIAATVCLA